MCVFCELSNVYLTTTPPTTSDFTLKRKKVNLNLNKNKPFFVMNNIIIQQQNKNNIILY